MDSTDISLIITQIVVLVLLYRVVKLRIELTSLYRIILKIEMRKFSDFLRRSIDVFSKTVDTTKNESKKNTNTSKNKHKN